MNFMYYFFIFFFYRPTPATYKRTKKTDDSDTKKAKPGRGGHNKKPEWVVKEVIRLRAMQPKLGCKKISDVFNRLYEHTRLMTVSRSLVGTITIKNKYAIQLLKNRFKSYKPTQFPKNIIWSIDLTTRRDDYIKDKNIQQLIFGVIDNGSRACLLLETISDKCTITLLCHLLKIIRLYGKPKKIRMDNEAVFKSRLFRLALRMLRIKQEFTEVACPWMNGRIERLFGTLKAPIKNILVSQDTLAWQLREFRFWYNHVRTHNNLNGKTPAEVWSKLPHNTSGKAVYVSLWDGELTGFYVPPD